jgi:hypothetical protein
MADPDLAYAWALDHSLMTSETSKHRLRRRDGEMARYGEEWSLARIPATTNNDASNGRRPLPQPTSSVVAAALCMVQVEAERIIPKHQAAAGKR